MLQSLQIYQKPSTASLLIYSLIISIGKLNHWYSFSAYLKSRKQRTRIGSAFSDYLNILFGVPQGSILGPILFIIFLSDLFYIYNDLDYANYADDTTPYVCRQNYAEAIEFLEPTINNIFAWFKNNGLVANSGKSHFLVSPYEKISLKILG